MQSVLFTIIWRGLAEQWQNEKNSEKSFEDKKE